MGRLVASVTVENISDPSKKLRCDALVDTGASPLVLPAAWKERLGKLQVFRTAQVETATQELIEGEIFGPVRIQIEGFDQIAGEVLFVDMEPADGVYEPLLGYIVLEQSQAAIDMLGHRLIHVKHFEPKGCLTRSSRANAAN